MTQSTDPSTASGLPAPPRSMTRRARRRSWMELPARPWLVLALLIGLITAIFILTRWMEARQDRRLIVDGVPVKATVVEIEGLSAPQRVYPRDRSLDVWVKYTDNTGNAQRAFGRLAQGGSPLRVGDTLDIRHHPDQPALWTDQTEPRSWWKELAAVLFLVPAALLPALMAWWRRLQVLRVWREGRETTAAVVQVRHSAVAPLSRVVRFRIPDDSRIFELLFPAGGKLPEAGQALDLLMLPGKPRRALAWRLYQD